MTDPQPYAVNWSIYTDLRGRRQFHNLYWDKLKDIIGRPAKLIGIEREDLWPSERPSRELRCHVWRYFSASGDGNAVCETLSAAFRVAPEWRVLIAAQPHPNQDEADYELFEIVWNRAADDVSSEQLPLPQLTSIMVGVHGDRGFRIRPGYTIEGGGQRERPRAMSVSNPQGVRGSFVVHWDLHVQTSTKRELMETHWPLLQRRFGGEGAEMIDLEKRAGDIGPFKFRIKQVLYDVLECEFLLSVLAHSEGMHISKNALLTGAPIALRGENRGPYPMDAHRVLGFETSAL